MMPKKILITGIVLLLITISGWVLFVMTRIQSVKSNNELVALLDDRGQQLSTALQKVTDLSQSNVDLNKELSSAKSDLDKFKNLYNEEKEKNTKYELEILDYKARRNCDGVDGYEFNLTSHATVSESLSILIGDTNGKVTNATWDTIWDNSKTATHKLNTSEYLFVFIVDLKDEGMNKLPSIFWVDQQCLLKLP